MRKELSLALIGVIFAAWSSAWAQCPDCGNGVADALETNTNCPQDVPHSATCTNPCAAPSPFETAVGIRQAFDFVGTTTWSTAGLPAGWSFAGGPSATTAGALPAADAYGAKAGLIQPNCSGSCTATNGFCIGNLASTQAVGAGGASGKLGANFDGRPNVNVNLSYAVLRGQNNPTLVSPTFNMSGVEGFKVQFWVFPSETSCGQGNSWGSCVGNVAFLDFSSNNGTSWAQILQMDLSSTNSDMCFNNSTNTKWLTESAWTRVCVTVFRSTTAPGNFYPSATATTAASGIMMNSAWFTNGFRFRVRYSQTASCTSGITTTNPGRYLAIDYPVITSGNEMIPCGISFINMCGYGADNNDDGVGSSTLTSNVTAHGLVRRSVNQAERGVEIFHSQNGGFTSQNLTGSNLATNFDLCNAEGGDKQCINWRSANNLYTVVYECLADWEASTSSINVQYYKGTTAQSIGMTKVTSAGRTPTVGWRYSANRFVSCGSLSDLNPGCNGYSFLSNSLPSQFARGFYQLAVNSTGQAWTFYGAASCSHYFNGPFFAPVSVPDTVSGSPNYTFCDASNQLFFTGLVDYCADASGLSGAANLSITGPGGFSETILSGTVGTTPITTPGDYTITSIAPTSPTQCVNCARSVCVTISATDITNCTSALAYPGLAFWGEAGPDGRHTLRWTLQEQAPFTHYQLQRQEQGGAFEALATLPVEAGSDDYQWVDELPLPGENAYRLRLLQGNGREAYSEVVRLLRAAEDEIRAWPNPAAGTVRLALPFPATSYGLELHDLSGRLMRSWQAETPYPELDLHGIAAGSYLLKATGAGVSRTLRLTVQ